MAKRRWDLNSIYISERLQECLCPIARSALTTVVAPMGYGKTTAVNWYLGERTKLEQARVLRISVYSDNLAIFWRSAQDAFSRAGLDVLRECACPTDAAVDLPPPEGPTSAVTCPCFVVKETSLSTSSFSR